VRGLRRWPLLLTGLCLVAAAIGVGATKNADLNPAAQVALMVLGAAFLGAFIHSQGGHDDDDPGPA
jgi:hypothetical protein